jgi:predicted PurR-regulated permease PerM
MTSSEQNPHTVPPTQGIPLWLKVLLGLASFVVIVAGMKAAAGLLVPFLLALFLAIISAPAMFWLQQKGIRPIVSILIVTLLLLAVGLLLGSVLARSIPPLVQSLPEYSAKLQQEMADLVAWIQSKGIHIDSAQVMQSIKPDYGIALLKELFSQIGTLTAEGLLIFFILVLILLEAGTFETKFNAALQNSGQSMRRLYRITADVKRYLAVKTVISLITAILVTVWMLILNVDYAVLWGMLTFALTFVPNIGAILSAIPPILLALIQMGTAKAILVAVGYGVVCGGLGNILELLWIGQRMGLSTLVVFLSLTFWGWALGPIGMLLSIPLTMAVKIVLQSNDDTRWIATILGTGPSGKSNPKKQESKN